MKSDHPSAAENAQIHEKCAGLCREGNEGPAWHAACDRYQFRINSVSIPARGGVCPSVETQGLQTVASRDNLGIPLETKTQSQDVQPARLSADQPAI